MQMKCFRVLGLTSLIMAVTAHSSQAGLILGHVFCDANANATIDAADQPVQGAHVVVTNEIGTFSTETETAVDGSFSLQIPNFDALAERRDPLSQTYIETIVFVTLPAGSTVLSPQPLSFSPFPSYYINYDSDLTNFVFNSGGGATSTGDWLISNASCRSNPVGYSLVGGFTNGVWQVRFFPANNTNSYSLERSTDLLDWIPVASSSVEFGQIGFLRDSNASPKQAYYRVRESRQ
jgi:hypothetical protein